LPKHVSYKVRYLLNKCRTKLNNYLLKGRTKTVQRQAINSVNSNEVSVKLYKLFDTLYRQTQVGCASSTQKE
jgi:hypothetical protein